MKKHSVSGLILLASTLVISGCVARTYSLTRDRIDQDLSSGNRGYLTGKAPEASQENKKTTRTTRVVEIELGFAKRSPAKLSGATAELPLATKEEGLTSEGAEKNEAQEKSVEYGKYTVGKNDTLQKISKKLYGTTKKWTAIYEANKATLKSPDRLYPGQVLNIPAEQAPKMPDQNLKETPENLK